MPKISVILSSFNHAPYIRNAIDSVLRQTFRDFELLIFDDGSRDDSPSIIRSYHDERIRPFLYETNRGAQEAYHETVQKASGQYVAVQHSDDIWEPDKLEKQAAFLDAHPEYTACFSQVNFIDEEGNAFELPEGHFYTTAFQQDNRSTAAWLRHFFSHPNCLCHPSLLIRRERQQQLRLLEIHGLRQLPDFYTWIRLLCHGDNFYIYPEKLVRFRLRRSSDGLNVSAETGENILRHYYEMKELAKLYFTMPAPLFQEAFPEFAGYVFDDTIAFAAGKLLLTSDLPSLRLLGLERIFALLNQDDTRKILKERYDYDENTFFAETGRIDCFGLCQNMHYASMSVIPGYDDDYRESDRQSKRVYIHSNGTFSVQFTLTAARPVRRLRFDPEEDAIVSVQLQHFTVNGNDLPFRSNGEARDDADCFYDGDPIYEVEADFSGTMEITVTGVMKYLHADSIVARQQQELKKMAQLEKKLYDMENSRSWKITAPLRRLNAFRHGTR